VSRPLDGPRLKVERAKRHARWLKCVIDGIEKDPHRVIEKDDPETGGYIYEVSDPTVDPRVGLVVGEAVHNLHTALDNLVWQLAQLSTKRRDAARQKGHEWPPISAQFPIFKEEARFKKKRRKMIGCLLVPHRQMFDGLQPCNRGSTPELDALWLLYALSITDKHHVLNTTVRRLTESPEAPFRVVGVNPKTGEPMHSYPNPESPHRALSVTVHPRFDESGYIAVEAEGKFPVEVEFGDPGSRYGSDIVGKPVAPLMDAAISEVEGILALFEPCFPS
jgi:hypothetical protein